MTGWENNQSFEDAFSILKMGIFHPFSLVFRKILPATSGTTSPKGVFFHHGHQQRWHWQVGGVGNLPPTSKFCLFSPAKKGKKKCQPWQKIDFCLEDDVVFFFGGYCRFQHLTKKLASHTGHNIPRIKGHAIYLQTHLILHVLWGQAILLHPLGEDESTCFNVIKIQSSDPKLRGAI